MVQKLWVFDVCPWRITLTFTCHPSTYAASWVIHVCQIQVSIFTGSKIIIKTTFDLQGWHWPYNVTPQNVRFHEIHIYANYQMSISTGSKVMVNVKIETFDLEEWPWQITPKNVHFTKKKHMHAIIMPQSLLGQTRWRFFC